MAKVDLDAMLGDWQSVGYSEEQATACAQRVQVLLGERTGDVADEDDRAFAEMLVWPAVLAQAVRDIPPDLIPPVTVREYEVSDPDDFLAVYRDEGSGPMKFVGVEYEMRAVGRS